MSEDVRHDQSNRARHCRTAVLAALILVVPMLAVLVTSQRAHATTLTFNYNGTTGANGTSQSWPVPPGVTQATFDVYGARGGDFGGTRNYGGRATATVAVTANETLQINVGGHGVAGSACQPGGPGAGGFNGGGAGGASTCSGTGGGGASDVRRTPNTITPTDTRLIVAGGGGGDSIWCGSICAQGGGGGGLSGQAGESPNPGTGGAGGGQTTSTGSGMLGQGGNGSGNPGGDGGGGGYIGGAGTAGTSAAGGGSGFGPSGVTFQTGVRAGDGLVTVSFVTPTTTSLVSSLNPSAQGQAATFSATVSSSSATGNVTFKDGATTLAVKTLISGHASLTTSGLSPGTHPVTAVYSGDSQFATSTSNTVNQVVCANAGSGGSGTSGGAGGSRTGCTGGRGG